MIYGKRPYSPLYLRFSAWNLRLELGPEALFSPARTPHLKQESTKVVRVFKGVVFVPDMVRGK
jgi:hypothetical protein